MMRRMMMTKMTAVKKVMRRDEAASMVITAVWSISPSMCVNEMECSCCICADQRFNLRICLVRQHSCLSVMLRSMQSLKRCVFRWWYVAQYQTPVGSTHSCGRVSSPLAYLKSET